MKDSTKIKLQKALIVLAGVGAVGGAVALAYMEGKDNGHELGYREGFEDGKGSDGDKHSYNQGVIDTLTAHKNFIYDPWTYDKCKYYISSNVYAGETEYSDSNKMAPDFRKSSKKSSGRIFIAEWCMLPSLRITTLSLTFCRLWMKSPRASRNSLTCLL